MKNFIRNLISKNSGESSTRISLIIAVLLTVIVVITCCFVMIYDTIKSEQITLDYFTGIAAVIGSTSVLIGSAGMTKAFSDKFQITNKNENI